LTSDVVRPFNNSALENVTDLSNNTVEAGKNYSISITGTYSSQNSNTSGVRIGIELSGGANGTISGIGFGQEEVASLNLRSMRIDNSQKYLETVQVSSTGIEYGFNVNIMFTCTVSGSLDVQFGAEGTNMGVTLHEGSGVSIISN
jgi:hypothetical protein